MSNIEINRKNIADMLLGLYEKEPFFMNTNVEDSNAMSGVAIMKWI